jgi:hypothetical protein
MKKNRQAEIIRELLALYQRYDELEVKDAIEMLANGEAFRNFLYLASQNQHFRARAEGVKPASRIVGTRGRRPTSRDAFRQFIDKLKLDEGEQARDIARFIVAIEQRQILSTNISLLKFARSLDVYVTSKKVDRSAIAKKIGTALLNQSPAERARIYDAANRHGGPSSLQAWSDIIVKK